MEGGCAIGLSVGHESHRDSGNEEVPGKEGAQPQDEEADSDQVVAVGISKKVTRRTHAWAAPPASQATPRESGLQPPSPRLREPRESADGNCSSIGLSALEHLGERDCAAHGHPAPERTAAGLQHTCPAGRHLAPWPLLQDA
jgi:hypothetical protein